MSPERSEVREAPVNEYSPLHPHEPSTPPVIDDEGRCLVCGVEVALQDVGRIVADMARRLTALPDSGERAGLLEQRPPFVLQEA